MHKFLLCSLLLTSGRCAFPQAPAPLSQWSRVQAVSPGTTMHVSTTHGGTTCKMKSASDDGLICISASKERTFARSDVTSIKLVRRAASTAVMAAVGAGAGAGAGLAVVSGDSFFKNDKGKAAGIGAVLGIVVLAPIGYFTDLARGPTVYRTP